MKKSFLLTIVFVFASVMISGAPSIKVTNPSGGSFEPGQKCKIVWSTSGRMNQNVKIRLFDCKSNQKIIGISDKTPNDRSFPWVFPTNLSDGNYYIKIRTVDNKVTGTSKCFIVKKKELKPDPKPDPKPQPGSDKIYNFKEPLTKQIDPKYMPKDNTFQVIAPNKQVFTSGKLTPKAFVINYGSYVNLRIEFRFASKVKVVNKNNGDVVYKWSKPVSTSKIIADVPVKVSSVVAEFEMNVFGPTETKNISCFIKTIPVVNNFNMKTVNRTALHVSYSFSGCNYAWLKKRDASSNKWVRVKKLSGDINSRNSLTKKGTDVVPNAPGYYALYLIGDNGVVKSTELKF